MDLVISKADLDDTQDLISILNQATRFKLAHNDLSWGDDPFTEREVRGLIKTNDTYVVKHKGETVGTFGLHWEDTRIWGEKPADAGYIHRLAIREDMHGQGLGKQIIDWALQEVERQDRQFLRLDTATENKELCGYYESLGFKYVGQKSIPPAENYFANLYERSVK